MKGFRGIDNGSKFLIEALDIRLLKPSENS